MSKRNNPDYPFRDRHDDLLQTASLCDRIELIKTVQDMTGASFDEVLKVYSIESINRLTEAILDAGDALDSHNQQKEELLKGEINRVLKWFYDNQPYKLEVTQVENQ